MIVKYDQIKFFSELKGIVAPSRKIDLPILHDEDLVRNLTENLKKQLLKIQSFNSIDELRESVRNIMKTEFELNLTDNELNKMMETFYSEINTVEADEHQAHDNSRKIEELASVIVQVIIDKKLFETLGCFKVKYEKNVFLDTQAIEKVAKKKGLDVTKLSEIIYIHECAHYIHFTLNPKDFTYNKSSAETHTNYLECWAQLCTKAWICFQANKEEYLQVFEKLLGTQSNEYCVFKGYEQHEKNLVCEFFLNEHLLSTTLWDEVLQEKADEFIDMLDKSLANEIVLKFLKIVPELDYNINPIILEK